MFDEITIQNFQSFRDKTISFCEGVNAIVGLSRSGKTTILRAIRWCAKNEPRGNAFQSWWGGDPSVRIKFAGGIAVTRRGHGTDNFYLIEKPGEKDIELTAFGVKVPEEVEKIFNMNSTCLQAQMDGVFFLSLKPGAVAKALNEAVNLNVIDSSVADIRAKKMDADKNLKFQKGLVAGKEEKVASFGYLEGLEVEIKKLEETIRREKSTKERLASLLNLLGDLEANGGMAVQYETIIGLEGGVTEAIEANEKSAAVKKESVELGGLLTKVNDCLVKLDKAKALSAIDSEVDEAQECYEKYKANKLTMDSLASSLNKLESSQLRLDRFETDIKELERELEEIMPDKCPILTALQKTKCPWGVTP